MTTNCSHAAYTEQYLESSMREQRLKTPAKQFRSEPSRPSTQSRGGVRAYNKDTLHSYVQGLKSSGWRERRSSFLALKLLIKRFGFLDYLSQKTLTAYVYFLSFTFLVF